MIFKEVGDEMGQVKKLFVEFKSIFFSNDVLKENETHANIVVATTMFNLFLIGLLTYILAKLNVFKVGTEIMTRVMLTDMILLLIPATICFMVRGSRKWLRVYLFMCYIIAMAFTDAILKYNVTLVMVLPLILAARYYNKKFTIWVGTFTVIAFLVSTNYTTLYGQQDLNSYNLIIPEGTVITVESTLRDAVTSIKVDETQRLKNIYLHLFLPKLFVYSMVMFACLQIAQSGKNMIEKQIEITDNSSRINTELALAYNIQKGMLPSTFPAFPDHDEIDIYAMSIPAKEVGGDFYDMFLIDDHHLALSMADVSGKGVPAALFMMVSQILLHVITDEGGAVSDVMTRVNDILSKDNKLGLFVTVWLGILDLQTGKMEYVNAGHNAPLLYAKQRGSFEYLKTKPNFVIAGMEKIQYETSTCYLEPGDRIFLYTDGVVESTNQDNQQYGESRLKAFLDQHMELDAKDTILAVKQDLNQFVKNAVQFDDITMLELQFKNQLETSSFTKEWDADITMLSRVQDFVSSVLQENGFDTKVANQIHLAVEEIFVNIVKYAYPNERGKCRITISPKPDQIEITFVDHGIAFNPLDKEKPDVSLPAEERSVGGLGIYMVEQMMDEVEYHYENQQNMLKIAKKRG